jgi:hypothetical protein
MYSWKALVKRFKVRASAEPAKCERVARGLPKPGAHLGAVRGLFRLFEAGLQLEMPSCADF